MKVKIPTVSILDKLGKEPVSFKLFPQTKSLIDILSEVTGKSKTQIIEESIWNGLNAGLLCSKEELRTLKKELGE